MRDKVTHEIERMDKTIIQYEDFTILSNTYIELKLRLQNLSI